MATARWTLTGTVGDLVAAPLTDPKTGIALGLKAWLETNLPSGEYLADLSGGGIQLLTLPITIGSLGNGGPFTVDDLLATDNDPADCNWQDFSYRVAVKYTDISDGIAKVIYSPWFALTADFNVRDAIEADYAPPTATSLLLSQMEALLAAQIDLSNIDDSDSMVSTLITSPLIGVLTGPALDAIAGRSLRATTNFASKANGALPTVDDLGRPIIQGGTSHVTSATVVSGKAVTVADGVAAAALYFNTDLGSGVRGWGQRASCVWPAAGGGQTTGGSFGVLLWADPYVGSGSPQSQAAVHFGVSQAGFWSFAVIASPGVITVVSTGFFTPPASDGVTVHETSYAVDPANGDFYARLPDGTVIRVTAAQVATASPGSDLRTLGARYACLEPFQNAATDVLPRIISGEVYTDPTADAFRARLDALKIGYGGAARALTKQPRISASWISLRTPPVAAETSGTWSAGVNTLCPNNYSRSNSSAALGDKVTERADVSAGQWAFSLSYFTGPDYGNFALEVSFDAGVSWIQIGATVDCYHLSTVVLIGTVTIAASATMLDGPYLFRIRVNGKNGASTGYKCAIAGDILLTRVSP